MYLILFGLISVWFASAARAQDQGGEWSAFTSMRDMNDVLVDRHLVWTATAGGVLRYNQESRTYTRFTRLDGLAGNRVLSLAQDDNGDLWFGTDHQGLSRFRSANGRFERPFSDFVDLAINAIVTRDTRVFVGTTRGVSVFLSDREEVKESYRQLGDLTKDIPVTALALVGDSLFVGTEEGLAFADLRQPNLQDPESWSSFRGLGEVRDYIVFNDTLFCATELGVLRFDKSNSFLFQEVSLLGIGTFGILDQDLVLVTREGQFYQRDGSGMWGVRNGASIPDARAAADVDGIMWLATAEGLRVLGATPPPPSREPRANHFYDMRLLGNGEIWVASVPNDFIKPHGVYQFDPADSSWTVHDDTNGLPTATIVALEVDEAGDIWAGTWGRGLAIRNSDGRWRWLDQGNSVLQGINGEGSFVVVADILRDEQNLFWITNVLSGLAVIDGDDPNVGILYSQSELGVSGDIGKVALGPDGLKWISTPLDGFLLFDDGGTPFEKGDEFSIQLSVSVDERLTSDRIKDIMVDSRGQVWVATDNGLNVVRGSYDRGNRSLEIERWRIYDLDDGLPSSQINAFVEDDLGNVWVGTEGGIGQITPGGEVAFALTTENSGLIDNRINSLLFDGDAGELWIGTFDGLSRLKIALGNESGSDELIVYPNPLVLRSRQSSLTFSGLPLGAELQIFDLGGNLVWRHQGTPGKASVSWRGQNQAGFLVGSGVYFFVARDETGSTTSGKFAVVNGRN
jgi:ligand-binding sensor domain-containing protein